MVDSAYRGGGCGVAENDGGGGGGEIEKRY